MSTTAAMESHAEEHVSGSQDAAQTVICLGQPYADAQAEQLQPLLEVLQSAFGARTTSIMIAYPVTDPQAGSWIWEGISLQPYQPTSTSSILHVAVAGGYLDLFEVIRAHGAACGLLLGAEAHTLHPQVIRGMVDAVLAGQADVVLPRYSVAPNDGLISAAILHPLTRAVFSTRADFPLALDLALSARASEKMAAAAQRFTAGGQNDALLWPTAEAAVNNFTVAEIPAGVREIPHPTDGDLTTVLSQLTSSLFSDIEAKATYWQRSRPPASLVELQGLPDVRLNADAVSTEEIAELISSFQLGYGNLQEIWAMVLPPQTLFGIKRVSRLSAETFTMPDALWVRIVYDFVLAHRMRTINRGHLLGALTPLYLAWVASHIRAGQAADMSNPPESLAKAFEADKPYLVSRWRWPDRFNP